MKNSVFGIIILAIILGFSACKGESEKKMDESSKEMCFYSYNSGSTVLEWTAFKFTEKSPVKGTFNEITIEGIEKSDDPKKLIESLKFTINTSTVETQNEDRNGKIVKFFFGTINTENITGKVKLLDKNGKAVLVITMNSLEKEVIGSYTLEDGKFDFKATIDLADWKAENAIEALNLACKDLHSGADGKTKLWSEVDLSFSTELMSDCE